MPPKKNQEGRSDFTDSDKAALDEYRKQREFEAWAAEREEARKRKRTESFKIWAQVLATALLVITTLKDGIPWLLGHIKNWLGP